MGRRQKPTPVRFGYVSFCLVILGFCIGVGFCRCGLLSCGPLSSILYTYIYTHIHTHIYINIYIYISIYTYTHIRIYI